MANTPSPSVSTDVVTDLVARYGRQAVQLFAALAGVTGLFYSIGFLIVNVSLLRLGVYETALISVGYVVPGIAFAVIFVLSAIATIGAFQAWQSMFGPGRIRRSLAVLASVASVVAGSVALGWAMWYFRNVALGLVVWSIATNLGVAVLAYAEFLPLINQMIVERVDEAGSRMSPMQARLRSPVFVLVAALLTFLSVLLYGAIVFDQVPPVFGGGLSIVVRFFGEDVGALAVIGIQLEPGETNLTERIDLITQTEDRYIARVDDRAVSFDKSFVRGIQYEPPEFFLDADFFLASHASKGRRFLEEERFDDALSEFNLVLDRRPTYAPALRGRITILRRDEYLDYDRAFADYRTLIQVEPQNGENFYGFAEVQVLRAQAQGLPIEIDDVVGALQQAQTISATLGEQARGDVTFDPLRLEGRFDTVVYGSGPAAARWFSDGAKAYVDGGAIDEAIVAYQWAITYAEQYQSEPDALSAIEIADLHLELSELYDPFSTEALAELEAAVTLTNQEDSTYLNKLAELYVVRGDVDSALAIYDVVLQLSTADNPDRRQALRRLGTIALEAEDYPRAIAAFSQALELFESDASIWYDYARALGALGDERTAEALRRAIELNLSLADTAQTTDWLPYFSNAGSAVENLISGAVHFKQARDLRDQGDLDGAIAEFQNATAWDDSVAAYWRDLGDVLVQAERYDEAVAAYQAALLRLLEPDATILESLGSAQIESGDAAGAIDSLTNAINLLGDATPATTYVALADAYELTGAHELAAAAFEQAALVDPANQVIHLYRSGVDWLLAGQVERSQQMLEPTVAQGGLRVTVAESGLRDTPSASGQLLKVAPVGATFSIAGSAPLVFEDEVWWEVVDPDGMIGYVRALDVEPSAPPDTPVQTAVP